MDLSAENIETQKDLLEKFILHNPELDKLESMLSEFNLFETLNMVNAEIRHSNMLAWLLDPKNNHALGSYFIHNFLKQVIIENKSSIPNLNIFDIEGFDYADVEILREWKNIDVLIIIKEDDKQYIFVIENKIKTSEHSNQLARYSQEVEKSFPEAEKVYVYLTPDDADPSEETWISFNYSSIAKLLDNTLKYRGESLGENIFTFIEQYIHILKRYHVGQSEIEKICQQIYKKHKSALDLIFEYKPDIESDISEYLKNLVLHDNTLILDSYGKTVIRFTTNEIDPKIPKISEGWSKSKRIIMYQFYLYDKRLVLQLYLGPGEYNFRKNSYEYFSKNRELFTLTKQELYTKHNCLYQKEYLKKKDFEELEYVDLISKIDNKWKDFLDKDRITIDNYISKWEN